MKTVFILSMLLISVCGIAQSTKSNQILGSIGFSLSFVLSMFLFALEITGRIQ